MNGDINVSTMQSLKSLPGYDLVWWLFTIIGFPISLPWLMYQFYYLFMKKRKRSNLKGKVVLITGASSGLGEALAHVFYNAGCKLILVARRKEELERVRSTLINTYETDPIYPPIVLPLDLSNLKKIPSEIEKVAQVYDGIDILINNAGVSYRGEVLTTQIEVDVKVMNINYFAAIAVAKAVLPIMIKRKSGHLVSVSSIQGKLPIPFRSAYAASKHALQAWSDCARAELAKSNVKVTTVSPGYIQTQLSINALTGDGTNYGVMDETTQQGYSTKYVAEQILDAVLLEKKDVSICPLVPKLAVGIRYLCPPLYFWIMNKRAAKAKKEN